jgi:acyl-coenzyme A thioesterase PaaI-like protein
MAPPGPGPLPPDAVRLTEPHAVGCFGCGPEGVAELHMVVHQVGAEVIGDVTFGPRHAAGHGAVHGGVVAVVCDDLLSYLLFAHAELAVTRTLEVGYLRPVQVGSPYRLTARIERAEGRRIYLACAGVAADGTPAFTGDAVFVRVDPAHFDRPGVRIHPRLLQGARYRAAGVPARRLG